MSDEFLFWFAVIALVLLLWTIFGSGAFRDDAGSVGNDRSYTPPPRRDPRQQRSARCERTKPQKSERRDKPSRSPRPVDDAPVVRNRQDRPARKSGWLSRK